MQLLEIDSIRTRLDEEFIALEPTLTGMRLVPIATDEEGMAFCEKTLNIRLPTSFIEIVARYDFGHFTIGPVAFCNRGNYFAWLTDINAASNCSMTLGMAKRPDGVIMIANSDQFAIFLNAVSGQVLALEHGDKVSNSFFVAAGDFELLLRGLGTAFFERHPDGGNEKLGRQIASLVSGNPENRFWQWIAA